MTYFFNSDGYRNQAYFIYSSHKTAMAAREALDDYYCSGEVCEAERPLIRKIGNRYRVLFPAD